MSITTLRYSSPPMPHACAKPFHPKILHNSFASRANQDCSINPLRASNQSGFATSQDCHAERVSRSPERSEGEASRGPSSQQQGPIMQMNKFIGTSVGADL